MPHPLVVNWRHTRCDVYIGRGSPYGNPFTHLSLLRTTAQYKVGTREESIEAFEEWLKTQPELIARVKANLRGKILGCYCAPLACHGDILARIANEES